MLTKSKGGGEESRGHGATVTWYRTASALHTTILLVAAVAASRHVWGGTRVRYSRKAADECSGNYRLN